MQQYNVIRDTQSVSDLSSIGLIKYSARSLYSRVLCCRQTRAKVISSVKQSLYIYFLYTRYRKRCVVLVVAGRVVPDGLTAPVVVRERPVARCRG